MATVQQLATEALEAFEQRTRPGTGLDPETAEQAAAIIAATHGGEKADAAAQAIRDAGRQFEPGETFVCLSDAHTLGDSGAVSWVRQLVHDAHGDMLPDDWRYRAIRDALEAIAETDDGDDLDDAGAEWSDGYADVYNGQLYAWLGSHLDRAAYVDDAAEQFGYDEGRGVAGLIALGQVAEAREVFDSVRRSLEDRATDDTDDDDDETDDDDDGESLRAFIESNREEIDKAIRAACPNCPELDDDDRADWIANDESLYTWARSQGVRV